MKLIVDYKVIKSGESCEYLEDFNKKAKDLLEQGFQPYGEPCIKQPPGSRFIQAFVKYSESPSSL